MALFTISFIGAKYWPVSQGPFSNNLWHCDVSGLCAVPGGQRHTAVVCVAVIPKPTGLSSIESGHGYPLVNILKHLSSGGQYSSCQPPGNAAHGFLLGSDHGGGAIAASAKLRIVNTIKELKTVEWNAYFHITRSAAADGCDERMTEKKMNTNIYWPIFKQQQQQQQQVRKILLQLFTLHFNIMSPHLCMYFDHSFMYSSTLTQI